MVLPDRPRPAIGSLRERLREDFGESWWVRLYQAAGRFLESLSLIVPLESARSMIIESRAVLETVSKFAFCFT
jgi:hypothetical protein